MKKRTVIIIAALLACTMCSCSRYGQASTGGKRERKARAEAVSRRLPFDVSHKEDIFFYEDMASWLGTPYVYGGNSRRGVDCSGFVRQVYRECYNITLNRTVEGIYDNNVITIAKHRLRTGDLVFFRSSQGRKLTHMGIYLKDGYFIHASSSRGVTIDHLSKSDYYRKNYRKSGRVVVNR